MECDFPVVMYRYEKATEEALYLAELHNIYTVVDDSLVDYNTFADDTYFYVIKHKRPVQRTSCGNCCKA